VAKIQVNPIKIQCKFIFIFCWFNCCGKHLCFHHSADEVISGSNIRCLVLTLWTNTMWVEA